MHDAESDPYDRMMVGRISQLDPRDFRDFRKDGEPVRRGQPFAFDADLRPPELIQALALERIAIVLEKYFEGPPTRPSGGK